MVDIDIAWRFSSIGSDERQTRMGQETSYFIALRVNISKTVRDTSKVTIND